MFVRAALDQKMQSEVQEEEAKREREDLLHKEQRLEEELFRARSKRVEFLKQQM